MPVVQQSSGLRIFIAGSSEIFGINQKEAVTCSTPTNPQNPYGTAKADAFHLVRESRKIHGIYACTGVLFSHESPLRPQHFVSQKIIRGACAIAKGKQDKLHLGNLSTKRDWGWAPEYVKAMEKMLTLEEPRDFILATGKLNRLKPSLLKPLQQLTMPGLAKIRCDRRISCFGLMTDRIR